MSNKTLSILATTLALTLAAGCDTAREREDMRRAIPVSSTKPEKSAPAAKPASGPSDKWLNRGTLGAKVDFHDSKLARTVQYRGRSSGAQAFYNESSDYITQQLQRGTSTPFSGQSTPRSPFADTGRRSFGAPNDRAYSSGRVQSSHSSHVNSRSVRISNNQRRYHHAHSRKRRR